MGKGNGLAIINANIFLFRKQINRTGDIRCDCDR